MSGFNLLGARGLASLILILSACALLFTGATPGFADKSGHKIIVVIGPVNKVPDKSKK
jgi:hypothetical protein